MIKIAHRGLINGPDKNLENNPMQIKLALSLGYDVEIDLNVIDGKLFLGHDTPDYQINESFLIQRGLWIHAKNTHALRYLATKFHNLNYFLFDIWYIVFHNFQLFLL